ncbi:hypothetical protein ACFL1X_00765 [Candidatus Hydrogenedentota bacterium]
MKIDPNTAISMKQEHVLCRVDGVELYSGEVVPAEQLNAAGSAFQKFCGKLDPNTCYIAAFVPDRDAEEVFYSARSAAQQSGIHMQATLEKSDRQRQSWDAYKQYKANRAEPEPEPEPQGDFEADVVL